MTIFRNPVRGEKNAVAFSLACVDVDPKTGLRVGSACRALQNTHPRDQRRPFFACPNKGRGREGKCDTLTFMYPRRWSRGKGPARFHIHQGIDILSPSGTPIQSVTAGRVLFSSEEALLIPRFGGYGKTVVVETPQGGDEFLYFLYAHCQDVMVREGDVVSEQDIIATVGTTCGSQGSPNERFGEGDAHLHFEVSSKRYPLGHADERFPGDPAPAKGRLDPRKVLEALGPWGMTEVHLPLGEKFERDNAVARHHLVETSPHGGYFPLGANNHWHGGVHLQIPRGSTIVAPFDATIVAARLDPDPARAFRPEGSTNFILLRHEIPELHFRLFQGEAAEDVKPTPAPTPKDRAVGRKKRCANDPADVVQVKQQLHAHTRKGGAPYYAADAADLSDGSEVTKTLRNAIIAFQDNEVGSINPDGVVDIPGKTWSALFDDAPPEEPEAPPPVVDAPVNPSGPPTDPKRTVYSLLMHLDAVPTTNALGKEFPWLTRIKPPPQPEPEPDPAAEEEEKRAEEEHQADVLESTHKLTGAVGAPNADGDAAKNDPDDVTWVHKRLIRFGYHPGPPSSTSDDALVEAIRSLQNEHHKSFKKKGNGDGRVDKSGGTAKLLHKTVKDLRSGGGGSKGKKTKVDPTFIERTTERDADGVALVMADLNVEVRSGEALWRSGQAEGYAAGKTRQFAMLDQIHWEVFSEHLLVSGWEEPLIDDNDDITADVPKHVTEFIEDASPELQRDGLLTLDELRGLYSSGRGNFLRRTPCFFINHWALDVDKAAAQIGAMGFDNTDLAARLRPMMWWDHAADVLPPSRFVWHYNPLEFLAEYSEHLATLNPPSEFNPETHPPLTVRVLYDDRSPMPDVVVELLFGIAVRDTATTRSNGEAVFAGVEVGDYGIRLQDPSIAPLPVTVEANTDNELEIVTDVEAPPKPRGTINVIVRKHTGSIAGDDVEVWLEHAKTGPVTNDFTSKGKLRFEDIVFGDYLVTAGDAQAQAVTLDKKKKNVTIPLPAPLGTLRIRLLVDKEAAANVVMEVRKKGDVVAEGTTDAQGFATFEVPEGHYKVFVDANKKSVKCNGDVVTDYTMKLAAEDAPDPEPDLIEGRLAVTVREHDDGDPVTSGIVFVVSEDSGATAHSGLSANGLALFELPPGDYRVTVEDELRHATVRGLQTTPLEIEIDG